MTFTDEYASRIIAAFQTRLDRKLKSNSMVQTTWGTVASVDAEQRIAGAYLYGETGGAYISGGFRVPETTYLTIGDVVKVAMDYSTGERWVEEVNVTGTAAKKVLIDLNGGRIRIDNTSDANLSSTAHAFQIGPTAGLNLILDNNEIMARNNGAASDLYLLRDGGDLYVGNPDVTAGSGFHLRGNGTAEIVADGGTPLLDFKNASADDFDVRIVLSDDDTLGISGGSLNITTGGQSYKHTGTQVVGSRKTGWGAPTGTPTRTTFATSTVTLPQLAERVKALIDDLTTHGLIGA